MEASRNLKKNHCFFDLFIYVFILISWNWPRENPGNYYSGPWATHRPNSSLLPPPPPPPVASVKTSNPQEASDLRCEALSRKPKSVGPETTAERKAATPASWESSKPRGFERAARRRFGTWETPPNGPQKMAHPGVCFSLSLSLFLPSSFFKGAEKRRTQIGSKAGFRFHGAVESQKPPPNGGSGFPFGFLTN